MKKIKLTISTVLIMVIAIVAIYETMLNKPQQGELRKRIYSYMIDKQNRIQVYEAAIALNGGKSANTCVYFLSEVLRRNDVPISKETANTTQILKKLNQMGWKKDTDYKNLQPGDIGFTTDATGNKDGIPTHTYIFMGWVEKGNYDYAYIVDNQAKDYDNKIYHISNIKNVGEANGFTKEAFSFFMRP